MVISHINFILKRDNNCKLVLKYIQLVIIPNLLSLEVVQNVKISNSLGDLF